ncbi:MAG: CPXCG motif-containing cysteine-rich protein [Gammaproteobacteria bacterium]
MQEEVAVQCPHCGETITLLLDLSEGDQSYVEDCAVCCAPILVNFSVDEDGGLSDISVDRE